MLLYVNNYIEHSQLTLNLPLFFLDSEIDICYFPQLQSHTCIFKRTSDYNIDFFLVVNNMNPDNIAPLVAAWSGSMLEN